MILRKISLAIIVGFALCLSACGTKKPVRTNEKTSVEKSTTEASQSKQIGEDYKVNKQIKNLYLREEQIQPFKDITAKYAPELEKVRNGKGSNNSVMEKLKLVKGKMLKELETVLNSSQIALYQKLGY